ncbi:bifunctional UDP-sugar hydrolase/5'-nucleotidase [Bdellovibrionota bacterium FG-2]
MFCLKGLCAACCFLSLAALANEPVEISILHTNDLHSHFRPSKTDLKLGGVARIKTLVDQLRAENPNTLLVDGGDWAEGNIYYLPGTGRESLRMMDQMGYDLATLGNHDWLNGADVLLKSIDEANPKFPILAANISLDQLLRRPDLTQRLPPFVIREVGGARIAFVGLVTYELIYDKFLAPVQILDPFAVTRELVKQLLHGEIKVDGIVVISHNSSAVNRLLLKMIPQIDLVIGAHDHRKYTKPVVVSRFGSSDGWLVEAGCFGQYLGQVKFAYQGGKLRLLESKLHQIDSLTAEDPVIAASVERVETEIENERGPIFHDTVGESHIELGREGVAPLMGSFASDSYLNAVPADFALDYMSFIYGSLPRGNLSTVDVFNSNPGIYHPQTGKAWTLQTLEIAGKTLSRLLNFLAATTLLNANGSLALSNLEVVFSPDLLSAQKKKELSAVAANLPGELTLLQAPEVSPAWFEFPIREVRVQGEPLDESRTYQMVVNTSIIDTLEFMNSKIPGLIPLSSLNDTGIEAWRAIGSWLTQRSQKSPIDFDSIALNSRLKTIEPDLGLYQDDIQWNPLRVNKGAVLAHVTVKVRNMGAKPSSASVLSLRNNLFGGDESHDPAWQAISQPQEISPLQAGETQTFVFKNVRIPKDALRQVVGVSVEIAKAKGEANMTNNTATRWFSLR